MTVTTDPPDVARMAAAYIRAHGLAKQELAESDGRACFNGAIMLVFAPGDFVIPDETYELWRLVTTGPQKIAFYAIVDAANRILRSRYGVPRFADVVQWNNEESRTAEEVAVLFDEVAKELSRGN